MTFKKYQNCVFEEVEEIEKDIILIWEYIRDDKGIPVNGICRVKNEEKLYFFCTSDEGNICICDLEENSLSYINGYIEDFTKYMGKVNHYGSEFSTENGEIDDIIFTEQIDIKNILLNPLFYTSFENVLNKEQNIIIEDIF